MLCPMQDIRLYSCIRLVCDNVSNIRKHVVRKEKTAKMGCLPEGWLKILIGLCIPFASNG